MLAVYIIIMVLIVGFAIYFVVKEHLSAKGEKEKEKNLGRAVLQNKKFIESMVANVESVIVYADGNDQLCHRLVEAKEEIKFFNPTSAKNVAIVDQKLANRIDDLKILTAKDNTQETCFRVLEEIEAYIIQRKKEQAV
ncbi:MAG: hypothetical protein J6J24_03240 [Clostridia bacterium]|nr:hypothetical protein [Clostridia bacterium]